MNWLNFFDKLYHEFKTNKTFTLNEDFLKPKSNIKYILFTEIAYTVE